MWMRGNRRIFCAKTNRIFACSNILIIQHVTVRDSGYYKCVSSSNNRSFYQASVMVPASIIDSEGEIVRVNAAALESVQLKCHVRQDSFPKSVEVLWQYDDSYIAIGNTLQLRDIDQNKMGVYKCSASNGYGDPATKSFHLETTKVALDVEVQVADSMGCQSQPSCLVCTLTYLVTSITLYYGIF
ncbi:hemicentin-1-like [Corticium candelabrum]|uniref:hemicentin-1-like n=1 Tax=Corticium candelabrum TaxID=121492 RepID=UPI002E26A18E|nr:hemicentin-1-like [Corticium candelabrum]